MANEKKERELKGTKSAQLDSSSARENLLAAARRGDFALVQWLVMGVSAGQGVSPDAETLYAAAESGNLMLVQWLVMGAPEGRRVKPDVLTLLSAAMSGNLAVVQWLMKEAPKGMRVDPSLDFLEFLSELGTKGVFSTEIKQWFEQKLQSKNTPTAAPISTRGISQQPQGIESKASTRSSSSIPVTSTSSSITTSSTYQVDEQKETEENQLISLHNLEHWSLLKVMASSPDEVITQTDSWINKTKDKLRQHTQTVIPANRQSLLLPDAQVYQHFVALSKLTKHTQEQYTTGDPTLFQHALSKEQMAQLSLQDYLQKAASVGNLALVQWLVAFERGTQRAIATQVTLLAAARSGSLELVQWLVAAERGAQRLHPDQTILSAAARSGNLALVRWLTAPERGPQQLKPSRVTLSFARLSGNRALVKWLKQVMQLQEWKDLFPTTAINKEILSYLPGEDILSFANTTRPADQLVVDSKVLVERIRSEFGRNIQTLIPANRQPLLLPHTHIYRHFTALKKLEKKVRNRYAIDDPALFQRALNTDVIELPLLYDCLDKAARVGNPALVQWLMAPERGAQRVDPDGGTLRGAAQSGNLALVQWLMAEERGAQRVDPDVLTPYDAAQSGNLALVQWLMAPERGARGGGGAQCLDSWGCGSVG
jgi:hypothetical protein